ncbi:MAG: hypothetical protein IJ295_00765 [Clostridia bacterium]|nr:hypothetical protein [Clostridia bacterium]
MTREKILERYSSERIAKVINICDNIFYGFYYATGVLETSEAIKDNIKKKVSETFIDFWGETHAEKISTRIEETNINFVYQTLGARNSIEKCLSELKVNSFYQEHGTYYQNFEAFEYTSSMLSMFDCGLHELLLDDRTAYYPNECLQALGVKKEDVLNNQNFAKEITDKILDINQKWKDARYSDNDEINDKLKFLEEFVADVKKDYGHYTESERWEHDPIVKTMDSYARNLFMDKYNKLEAFYDSEKKSVYFGIMPSDEVVLHEFIHAVDQVGFEKGRCKKGKTLYSKVFQEYQIFNEVVTDYLATLMYRKLQSNNQEIVSQKDFISGYSLLFDVMEKFILSYLPELKETRLREFPAEEFMRVIGEKQFEEIALLCNEIIACNHDKCIMEYAQETGTNVEKVIKDKNETLYGGPVVLLSEVINSEEQANRQLTRVLKKTLLRQPLTKVIGMLISGQGRVWAQKLNGKAQPHLHKMAQKLFALTDTIEDLIKRHVVNSLKPPIQKVDLNISR